ncbi:MAG TPA: TlpA disulfide reductase family protein [Acidobacteriota bacterium]|jgi:thiol-disulfide isomerase/thioredoxin
MNLLSASLKFCCLIALLGLSTLVKPGAATAQSAPSTAKGAVTQPALSLDSARASDLDVGTLDGRRVKLSELIGNNHPVLVDFWATWCAPCRKSIPHIVKLDQEYKEKGLVVVGLTIEKPDEDMNKVEEFVQKYGIAYPVAFASPEVKRFFNDGKERMGVPRMFVFAADGSLVKQINGYNPLTTKGKLADAVKQAVTSNAGGRK